MDCSLSTISGATNAQQARPSVCEHFAETKNEPYLDWYEQNNIAANYPRSTFLSSDDPDRPQDGAAFHWKIVTAEEAQPASSNSESAQTYVHFAIATRAKGWLGFGLKRAACSVQTSYLSVLYDLYK